MNDPRQRRPAGPHGGGRGPGPAPVYRGGPPPDPVARRPGPNRQRTTVFRLDDAFVPMFLPCAAGVEPLLADECALLLDVDRSVVSADPTRRPVTEGRGGVTVRGDLFVAMGLNLESRLAQRVLWPVVEGHYEHEQAIYDLALQVDWAAWITPDQTLRVDTTAHRSPLRSLNFAALRVKDAVCDRLREATGRRPSVDTRHPHLALHLHLDETMLRLSVDLSGQALFKRGWRDERDGGLKGEAPLKETLAAAMLAAAGWHGRAEDGDLLDPCCGAGTIAIEAAQIACNMAPGLNRRFAFERHAPFQPLMGEWRQMRQAAIERRAAPEVAIHAGDVSFRMTDFAQRNAERAGVAQAIRFKTGDALQRPPPSARGVLVMNPPYGTRIDPKGSRGLRGDRSGEAAAGMARAGREQFEPGGPGASDESGWTAQGTPEADRDPAAGAFFDRLAAHWKRHYAGWTAWVLSPDPKLPQALRLKASRRVPMWNGPIECRLFRFDLVSGRLEGPREVGAPTAAPPTGAGSAQGPAGRPVDG